MLRFHSGTTPDSSSNSSTSDFRPDASADSSSISSTSDVRPDASADLGADNRNSIYPSTDSGPSAATLHRRR